jgi:hypothetical protein
MKLESDKHEQINCACMCVWRLEREGEENKLVN